MNKGLHWRRAVPLAALIFMTCAAVARPVLVPPKQHLAVPPAGVPEYEGHLAPMYLDVAVDEGTLLVSALRPTPGGPSINGVYIFERDAQGQWQYAGALTEAGSGDLTIDGSVATVRSSSVSADGIRVFERGAAGWAQTGVLTFTTPNEYGHVVRIEDGSVFIQPSNSIDPMGCAPPLREFRRVGAAWTLVATIGGERCDETSADVNDGRALIVHRNFDGTVPHAPAETFTAATPTWAPFGTIAPPQPPSHANRFLPGGTIRGDTVYIDRGYFFRRSGDAWVPASRLVEPEVELTPNSQDGLLRGNHLFLKGWEHDYELPSDDWETTLEWQTVRVYRQTDAGHFVYHARLNPDFNILQWAVSDDGRQAAATGWDHNNSTYAEPLRLYVFDVPDTASFPGTQQDTFSAGNFSRWTVTAGQFSVPTSGATRVLRQSSLAGESGAHLTAVDWTDQSIEADMRPLQYDGTGRWFGLVTRRTDAQNYYYVTFRAPNIVSLRRMRNGVFTELRYAVMPQNFQLGRNYRVRLESVGDQHAVFVDGIPRVHVKDRTLSHGHPGVAGYRTRFDVDNVIVSGGTRVLFRLDGDFRAWSHGYATTPGTWSFVSENGDGSRPYFLRQADNQVDSRWISTISAGYQVVSTRIRPQSYGSGSDPWVGLATHVVDDGNYYYITLRRSQQLSLRRLVNGQVQVLATVPQAVTLGAWHDLRLEVIGTRIRAFVNGDLKIEMTDSALAGSSGRNALLMYRTAADVQSYVAYQP